MAASKSANLKEQQYYKDEKPEPGSNVNSYLSKLYQTYEQEIRGENKPIEDCDNRPNYIGMCMHMMETAQEKIGCLRKVREMTAMNPFYQYRIDRFIDAITDTYEPTDKPGFTEYIRGSKDSIHEQKDFLQKAAERPGIFEGGRLDDYLYYLDEIDPSVLPAVQKGLAVGGAITAANLGVMGALKRKKCKQAFPNNPQKYKECVAGVR